MSVGITTRLFRDDIPDREESFLIAIAPQWSLDAGEWLRRQDASWRAMARLFSVCLLIFGVFMLAGTWYTSIQGVRAPLYLLGFVDTLAGIPAWPWWFVPASGTVIQVFSRKLPWLRPLWWPSIVYDGATNAVAFGLAAVLLLQRLAIVPSYVWLGVLVSLVGLCAAVWAEKVVIGAIVLLVLIWKK